MSQEKTTPKDPKQIADAAGDAEPMTPPTTGATTGGANSIVDASLRKSSPEVSVPDEESKVSTPPSTKLLLTGDSDV